MRQQSAIRGGQSGVDRLCQKALGVFEPCLVFYGVKWRLEG
jgi:hypothetical protein